MIDEIVFQSDVAQVGRFLDDAGYPPLTEWERTGLVDAFWEVDGDQFIGEAKLCDYLDLDLHPRR